MVVPQKKSVFLKYLLAEQHKKSRKNLAESFDFPTIFKKIRNEKAQQSTILEGGSFVPSHAFSGLLPSQMYD